MNCRVFLTFIVIGFITLPAIASDWARCLEKHRGTPEEWACFKQLEYTAEWEYTQELPFEYKDRQKGTFGIRTVTFSNEETLAELHDETDMKMLSSNTFTLYKGLSEKRTPFSARMGIGYSPTYALGVLVGSKVAPSSLPLGTISISNLPLNEPGQSSVQGTINRNSTHDYLFDAVLGLRDGRDQVEPKLIMKIAGRWSDALAEDYYPDEMLLTDWQYGCLPKDTMNLREYHQPIPPDVTLGDVRRGWTGSCDY